MSDELEDFFELLKEEKRKKNNIPAQSNRSSEEKVLIERTLGLLGGETNAKTVDKLTPLNQDFITRRDFEEHYKEFIARVQHQLSTIGGGGEVNFRYLDDVNRSTMGASNDNWVLEYDAATGKAQFTTDIGPIESVRFDPTHVDNHTDVGTLCWNTEDETLNLQHPNGVKQQIGQETYAYVRNKTGVEIPNGTAVQFTGAEQNGTSRLLVAPMLADGTYPSLYVLGIATENIADGEDGKVTVWGKLRDIDTSDWEVGDLLYVSPETAGALTNVKPTAPDNCIPVAAVLRKDATEGEIFVRPTIEQQNRYGTFSDSTDQTLTSVNQAKAVTLNTSETRFGISIDEVDTSKVVFSESGLYPININIQLLSTNSSAKTVWIWLRKNGVDVPYSSRVISIVGNNTYTVFQVTHNISMDADDYMQIMWAGSDTTISLKAVPATAFAPASPSVHLHIDQGAL